MADYIYLLESRLSKSQQNALLALREIAREKGLTIFLVGGAVRDLTSGSPVRDLDVVVQGNALKLKKDIEKAGGRIVGEQELGQALFLQFPRGVKLELGSTLSVTYPKPGKPVFKAATILDDLRRRDFTANAMALSLNDGSYGLLMDPLNGVADIENRELRLVSNYGFIEDPIRMIRAARLMARLGWQMDEKTATRYETAKQEGYITAASKFQVGYEAEEIVHEEDPLRVLTRLEAEGWMKVLVPFWTAAKVNVAELERLRETQTRLQMQGVQPNTAAANFPLLTAKLSPKEIADLKASFPRQGFVKEIEELEDETKELAAQLSAKTAALPSQAWKLLHSAKPEAVLMVAHGSAPGTKGAALRAKFESFFNEWPQARQKVPYSLMQEMRITPDLPGYAEFVESVFFELMDGKLTTTEELKAFLEPFSPPAPPPPVHLRRPRAAKKAAKGKGRVKKGASDPAREGADVETPEAAVGVEAKPVEAVEVNVPAAEPVAPKENIEVEKVAVLPVRKAQVASRKPTEPVAPVKAAARPATKKAAPASAARTSSVAAKVAPAKKAIVARKTAPQPKAKKAVGKADTKKNAVGAKTLAKKAPAKAAAQTPAQTPSKTPKKLPAKGAVRPNSGGKSAVKSPVKGPVKSPVKGAVKKARR